MKHTKVTRSPKSSSVDSLSLSSCLSSVSLLTALASSAASLMLPSMAFAADGLRTSAGIEAGGESATSFGAEICVIPRRLSPQSYSKGDLKDEAKLCGFDFYGREVAICPKLNSTNPGTLVVEIPEGWTRAQAMKEFCKKKSDIGKNVADDYDVQAKFKQSITCSYAPSALAAYHIGRMLGDVNQTPVAVVRTMSSNEHEKVVDQALGLLSRDQSVIIYKTWNQFKGSHQKASDPKIFADGGRNLFGALSKNVKREFIYTEVSGVGPYDTRYTRFAKQAPFQKTISSKSVPQLAGGQGDFRSVMPVIQQLRDVSDMVVLDTLLAQDDRIGNIHFHLVKFALVDGKVVAEKLDKAMIAKVVAKLPRQSPSRASEADFARVTRDLAAELGGGVVGRMMVLKDNDCGVDVDRRSNHMRGIDAIEQVRHMNPQTYQRLLKLADMKEAQLKDFFENTLLYRPIDFAGTRKSFRANLQHAAQVVQQNCRNGLLKLDLVDSFDASGHWVEPRTQCEI